MTSFLLLFQYTNLIGKLVALVLLQLRAFADRKIKIFSFEIFFVQAGESHNNRAHTSVGKVHKI